MSASEIDPYSMASESVSMASSIESPRIGSPDPLPLDTNVGVGLSSGSLNLSRRKMLDLVNKLASTGRVYPSHMIPII